MLKNFLKNTGKGLVDGKGVKESSEDAVKQEAKDAVKRTAKKAGKKAAQQAFKSQLGRGALRLLAAIMIPWGALAIICILGIAIIASYFTASSTDNQAFITASQQKMIIQYANEQINTDVQQDFYDYTSQCVPSAQIIENYIKYLIINKDVPIPVSNAELKELIRQAVKGLTPKFTFENGQIVTTTITKGKKNVSKQNIKLLKTSESVYGDFTYIYKDQTSTSKYGGSTVTTETPVLLKKSPNKKEEYQLLTTLLESHGVAPDQVTLAIGAILFSKPGDMNSWNWLFKDHLPPPPVSTTGSFGGGFDGGNIAGLPARVQAWQKYYEEAAAATGVPNWWLVADTYYESSFNPNAVSCPGGSAHAYGLLQFWGPNWYGDFNQGLGSFLAKEGYTGSASQIWSEYMGNPRLQIMVGAWEWRFYFNYTLIYENKVPNHNYDSTSNMKAINWNAPIGTPNPKDIMLLTAYIYNCGQGYIQNYQTAMGWPYSNNVYNLAMKYRSETSKGGIIGGNIPIGGNFTPQQKKIIESAIQAGEGCIGNSSYVYGGGRTMAQQAAHIFDCSSFVWYCFHQAGYTIMPLPVITTYTLMDSNISTRIPMSQIQPGDLIIFNTDGPDSHVGIYIGNGAFLNDESTRGGGVRIGHLSAPYWKVRIACVLRLHIP